MYKVRVVLTDGTELEAPVQDVEIEVCGTTFDVVEEDDISALVKRELIACFMEGYLSATELAVLIDGTDKVTLSDREIEELKETVLVIVDGKTYSWMDVKEIYVTHDEEGEDADERITQKDVLGIEVPAEGEAVVSVLGHKQVKKIPISEFAEKYWDTLFFCSLDVHPDALVRIGKDEYVLEFKGGVAVIDYDRFDLKPKLEAEDGDWVSFKDIFEAVHLLKNLHITFTQHIMGEADVSELVDEAIKLKELREKLGHVYDSIIERAARLLWVVPYIEMKEK